MRLLTSIHLRAVGQGSIQQGLASVLAIRETVEEVPVQAVTGRVTGREHKVSRARCDILRNRVRGLELQHGDSTLEVFRTRTIHRVLYVRCFAIFGARRRSGLSQCLR